MFQLICVLWACSQVSVLMGEPYFGTSLLPWHSLFFWYCRTALAQVLQPNATILPSSATLYMMGVEFRVRSPLCILSPLPSHPFVDIMFENRFNIVPFLFRFYSKSIGFWSKTSNLTTEKACKNGTAQLNDK